MTLCVVLATLIPIFWANGIGSDVMKPIAAPLVGGIPQPFIVSYKAQAFFWREQRVAGDYISLSGAGMGFQVAERR
jgi:hypothetical protein